MSRIRQEKETIRKERHGAENVCRTGKPNMRIVFMGTPDFAVPCLKALLQAGHEIAGVFTQPDKPKNRGHQMTPPPVKVCAQEAGLAVFQPTSLKTEDIQALLRALAPELIVVVAYGKILPQTVLDIPKYGCINVHASLLPKYRGAGPHSVEHSEWGNRDRDYHHVYGGGDRYRRHAFADENQNWCG